MDSPTSTFALLEQANEFGRCPFGADQPLFFHASADFRSVLPLAQIEAIR